MKHESLRRPLLKLLVLPLLAAWLASSTPAQEPDKKAEDPAQATQVERKKPRGRLPMYFAKVVSSEQREEIYEIQAHYADQIEKLQEQLNELIAKRDAEVDGVLSAEQLEEVETMRRERSARLKSTDKD